MTLSCSSTLDMSYYICTYLTTCMCRPCFTCLVPTVVCISKKRYFVQPNRAISCVLLIILTICLRDFCNFFPVITGNNSFKQVFTTVQTKTGFGRNPPQLMHKAQYSAPHTTRCRTLPLRARWTCPSAHVGPAPPHTSDLTMRNAATVTAPKWIKKTLVSIIFFQGRINLSTSPEVRGNHCCKARHW